LDQNANKLAVTIIEIRPFRNGWQVFEAPGVEPSVLDREHAIDYANCRPFRSGEIRVVGLNGAVERGISFGEADRMI